MSTNFMHTVDVESDWGGRTNGNIGIKKGIPRILEIFRSKNIKAIFFISTEILKDHRNEIYAIKDKGHEIGSHGHFHVRYRQEWRWKQDREISELLLTPFKQSSQKHTHYRAPWFNREVVGEPYSEKANHVSVLKQTWFGGVIPKEPIFYIHPFDIVHGVNPPDLIRKVLYGRPDMVYNTFDRLTSQYPGTARLR